MKDFSTRSAEYLRAAFPAETKPLSDLQLRAFVQLGIGRARGYEIRSERDVHRFVEMQVLFGAKFDEAIETPWAGPILNDPAIEGSTRVDLLFAAATWKLESETKSTISPEQLKPSGVQLAFDALWRGRPALNNRGLSLGAVDQPLRDAWRRAFESTVNGVEPFVADPVGVPEADVTPIPPGGDQPVGHPMAWPRKPRTRGVDIVCWGAITQAVAQDPGCSEVIDRCFADQRRFLTTAPDDVMPDQRIVESPRTPDDAWLQIKEVQRSRGPDSAGPSARIAEATAQAVRSRGLVWIKETGVITHAEPFPASSTKIVFANDQAWVFDWYATLNVYDPRVISMDEWSAVKS